MSACSRWTVAFIPDGLEIQSAACCPGKSGVGIGDRTSESADGNTNRAGEVRSAKQRVRERLQRRFVCYPDRGPKHERIEMGVNVEGTDWRKVDGGSPVNSREISRDTYIAC